MNTQKTLSIIVTESAYIITAPFINKEVQDQRVEMTCLKSKNDHRDGGRDVAADGNITVDTYFAFMKARYYSKYFHYILSHSILITSIGERPCYYLHFAVVETEA